jgi:benzoyl-CoA reductase subunit C
LLDSCGDVIIHDQPRGGSVSVAFEGHKIGYFCSYVPKEIIYAFGRTPVRVLPTAARASEAEAFLPRNFCSLVKVTLASFLEDPMDLEGVIHADSCDALRRLHDVWRHYVDVESLHLLDLPRNSTSDGVEYFRHALQELIAVLEERWQAQLTADSLAGAIRLYNQQRTLLGRLEDRWSHGMVSTPRYYELRHRALGEDPVGVNEELQNALADIVEESPISKHQIRVMLVGSLLTHDELVEAIERRGGRVVAEDSCTIGRERISQVETSADLDEMVTNLAAAYLNKPPCPRMRDFARRTDYLAELTTSKAVDGVVAFLYKFCDLFLSEYPLLRQTMLDRGIPILLLEDEGEASLSGQHLTRLEAFLEVLQ